MLMTDPGEVFVAVTAMVLSFAAIKAIANGVVRYAEVHSKRGAAQIDSVTDARLERIEHAMDAIAIEVERISEAQRFTTKLLMERSDQAGPAARLPG